MKTLSEEMHYAPVVLCLLAAAAWPAALCQNPVPIQFQTSPVLVRTGAAAVLDVITVSSALSISWVSPSGITLGLWVGGQAVLNNAVQYTGRITITATQLQISPVLLTDTGNYTVIVDPGSIVGMRKSSGSVLLHVFDAVAGVKLSVPPVALEGSNISLTCTWTMGTETSMSWTKGGTTISPDYRITVTGNSLVINPGNRSDAGGYSCMVYNLVSATTATASLTVYYGPDAPVLQQNSQANCVGGGQAVVGQTLQLACTSVSLPPALFSWQQNGQSVAADQVNGGVLTLQAITTNQSGQYVCMARNVVTTQTAKQSIGITIVKTCLSVGAVAGIVVACALAVIFIIIGIILLLCCRNRDSRLRGDKPNPSSAPATDPLQPAPQSSFWNRAPAGYSDPPLHSPNMLPDARQQYGHTSRPPQPNGPDTCGLQGNPSGPVSNHGHPDGGGLPPGKSYAPESLRNRTQTGHAPPDPEPAEADCSGTEDPTTGPAAPHAPTSFASLPVQSPSSPAPPRETASPAATPRA
ncbi:sialic acid-binding Ig-like lectin 8 isoform X3 [Brienomyrus brachyistius]|uniref:sialic acid-binding Ig-like lectin 8 isoform X3 n=1 Tax=Brienomyrus brachyistius TaxID=42636 RepID=UPI0020B3679B|nr:sialic acid-binding Ig-like lectin 8 isoform X3 [Brienomyrus brachyistius]